LTIGKLFNHDFFEEPTFYEKTALSDLQGAWLYLRDYAVKEFGFENSDKLLFYIDEAMSWECVRDIGSMKPLILLIDNIAKQADAPDSIIEAIEDVRHAYEDILTEISKGKI